MADFIPKKVVGKFMHVTDVPLKRTGGKSLVYFFGAGFCPFCAAQRWAIVEALNKFGSWSGLADDSSADHDEKYLNVPTVSFARASYSSEYVEFIGRETADRNFEPSPTELNEADYEILDTYNPDQVIPFLLVDGQFLQVGAGYSPQLLAGLDHKALRAQLQDPASVAGNAIKAEANNIAALICKSIGSKAPGCAEQSIKTIVAKL
ncbi:MAG TPA: DUF929 family protein [Nitrososphaera sp.]|nr:DUF929 family protein [Nitrososphaera sp.]